MKNTAVSPFLETLGSFGIALLIGIAIIAVAGLLIAARNAMLSGKGNMQVPLAGGICLIVTVISVFLNNR